MCHEIYTIYLPIGTVATCEYCGRVFGCDFNPFSHFLRAWGLCSSGKWRRVTVLLVPDVWRQSLKMKPPRCLETADTSNTVVRRNIQKNRDLILTLSLQSVKSRQIQFPNLIFEFVGAVYELGYWQWKQAHTVRRKGAIACSYVLIYSGKVTPAIVMLIPACGRMRVARTLKSHLFLLLLYNLPLSEITFYKYCCNRMTTLIYVWEVSVFTWVVL